MQSYDHGFVGLSPAAPALAAASVSVAAVAPPPPPPPAGSSSSSAAAAGPALIVTIEWPITAETMIAPPRYAAPLGVSPAKTTPGL